MLSWPERFRMLARELGPLGEFNGHYRASMHCTGDRIDFIHNESVTFASIIKSEGSMFFIDDIASEADSRADGFQFDDLDSECLPCIREGVWRALRNVKIDDEGRRKHNMERRSIDLAALADL
jgi:hypothetical protein